MQTYDAVLAEAFRGLAPDVTEENIQSRIRGNLLMALSNKFGSLLLTTGNKSEMSVGYCTLYGDMNGGLAVIADLPKMMVYRVSRWRNRRRPDIPEAILTKAPSAELRPDQTDQDSLPPYDLLDQILELHVEQCQSAEEIIAQGFDEADGSPRPAAGAHCGIQAKTGRPGAEGDLARVRHRLADADCTTGVTLPSRRRRATRCPGSGNLMHQHPLHPADRRKPPRAERRERRSTGWLARARRALQWH